MKTVRIKRGQTMKLRKVIAKVFADKQVRGSHARLAKKYFAELIIGAME